MDDGSGDPWGTTAAKAQFKAYNSQEMRNSRSQPTLVKTCLELPAEKGPTPLYVWNRNRDEFPDRMAQTSITFGKAARVGKTPGPGGGGELEPAWAKTHLHPIKEMPFVSASHYTEHEAAAQQARHEFFPHRDEFAPRSKRLLYELALAHYATMQQRNQEGGGDVDDKGSCFTITDSCATTKTGASRSATHVSRASSLPSISSRLPTADSLRVPGGVAKRRREAFFRAPGVWEPDARWLAEKMEKDGPAGLANSNLAPTLHAPTFDKYKERMNQVSSIYSAAAPAKSKG